MAKIINTYCSSCENYNNQKVLFSKELTHTPEGELPEHSKSCYMVVQCAGCDTISFLLREIIRVEEENENPYIDYNYPDDEEEESDFEFLKDNELKHLPKTIRELYEEVSNAFDSHSKVLSGIGLRTLVEAVCLKQNVDGLRLIDKIKSLKNQGLISESEHPILDNLRVIGNQSTHEIKQWPMNKLEYALQIINHLLRSIYILPKINKKLMK